MTKNLLVAPLKIPTGVVTNLCHMAVAVDLVPYGSVFTAAAIWQCFYCHTAMPRMPYGNALNAIWQYLDCHMAVSSLSMAVSYCQMAVAPLSPGTFLLPWLLLQCASQSAKHLEIF